MASSKLNNNVVAENNYTVIEGNCKYTNAENKSTEVAWCDVYLFENENIKTKHLTALHF